MSEPFETIVTGVGVWLEGVADTEAWLAGASTEEAQKPQGNGLD